jgi:hypothetical protein
MVALFLVVEHSDLTDLSQMNAPWNLAVTSGVELTNPMERLQRLSPKKLRREPSHRGLSPPPKPAFPR